MAVQPVMHKKNGTSDTSRSYSLNLWANCPIAAIREGSIDGIIMEDDFLELQSEDGTDDVYQKYIDTGNTIRLLATTTTLHGGVVRLATDATDNDGPVLARSGANAGTTASGPFIIGNTANAAFPIWAEFRFKKSSVTDNQAAVFLGLMGGSGAARAGDNGVLTDDTGDIVDSVSAIGFRVLHDNGEELDFAWQDAAQTSPVEIANIATLTADTWIKVGFFYNPQADASKKIRLFVNNVEYATAVTTTNIDAATFPENDALLPVFALKNGEATACNLDIDRYRIVQVFDSEYLVA